MMTMMMLLLLMMIIMTIVSVEQRPGWGEQVYFKNWVFVLKILKFDFGLGRNRWPHLK